MPRVDVTLAGVSQETVSATVLASAVSRQAHIPSPGVSTSVRISPAAVARTTGKPTPTVSAVDPPTGLPMVVGAAIGRYPSQSSGANHFNHHVSLFGDMPCFRTYEGGGLPSTWGGTSNVNAGAGQAARWTWASYKPGYTAYIESTTPSSNSGYGAFRDFIDTIPVNGMIKILTIRHEQDVNDKYLDTGGAGSTKLMWYVAGKAVQDSGHPEVLYALIGGSKDTTDTFDIIMNGTWSGATVAQSTNLLRSVVDVMAWDPYNGASQQKNWAANRQDPAFFFDPIVAWNIANFPDARFAVAETGYRPNIADLSLRPTWIGNMVDYMVGVDAMTLLYFDLVVATAKQNWLGEYVNPQHDGLSDPYTFPSGTTFPADTGTISAWSQVYDDFPAYTATAAQLSNIR